MSPREPRNVGASVRGRLTTLARQRREDVQATFADFVRERFLYRLGRSPHAGRVILKGAALFRVWDGSPHRITRDTDFLTYGDASPDAVAALVRNVCRITLPTNDGLVFNADSIRAEAIRLGAPYDGIRVRGHATLDGARIPFHMDFGFGDVVVPEAVVIEYPTVLAFPAPRIRAYPREAVVAEKFQAIVMLGDTNTRFKDFYDLWFLLTRFAFDGERLANAVRATFEHRGTRLPVSAPAGLSPEFAAAGVTGWNAFLGRSLGPTQAGVPPFPPVVDTICHFLLPLGGALANHHRFNQEWNPGGPWTSDAGPELG